MPDPSDVTPDSSPAPDPSSGLQSPAASPAVTEGEETSSADRPIENAVREFNRKFTRIERQLEALAQLQSQPRAAVPATSPDGEPTDEQLWERAQHNDRQAFDTYMQRIAARQTVQLNQVQRMSQLVDSQLMVLGQKYPVLQDQAHPLAQTAAQAYQILMGQGYPQSKATWLEAVKTAIADRPDLVAEMHGQAVARGDQGRQAAARVAQAGQTPASGRAAAPAPKRQERPLSAEERDLAARMGIKDPQKARENFRKRRESGVSQIGAVGMHLSEEDL